MRLCYTGSGLFWRKLTNRLPKIRPEELGPSAVAAQGPETGCKDNGGLTLKT